MQPVPDPGGLPLPQPPPRSVPGPAAKLRGQVPPPAAGVQHEQDPLQRGPVLDPRAPTRTAGRRAGRDQRLEQLP
jgi:hypothetical protein